MSGTPSTVEQVGCREGADVGIVFFGALGRRVRARVQLSLAALAALLGVLALVSLALPDRS